MKYLFQITAALLLLTTSLTAQDAAQDYMELMKPGPEHKNLAALAGTWDMTVKMWQAPGQQPMVFEGTTENRMILGGRFLMMESVSGEGQFRTETMSIMGYDRRHNKYTSVGYDTWGTYYVTSSGDFNAEKKRFELYGEDSDPVMGMDQKYNVYITWVDDDTVKTEIVFLDFPGVEEKEYKMVELTYRRQ